jgi:hypothetical protein
VIVGKSSFLPPVSKSFIYLTGYRMNRVGVQNAEQLGVVSAVVAMVSLDRCMM